MTRPELTLARFRALRAAYGTHLARWPEAERQAARELLASSEPARRELQEEAGVDGWLDRAQVPELDAAVLSRLLAVPSTAPMPRRLRVKRRALWAPALGWAAAAAVGLWLGAESSDESEPVVAELPALEAAGFDETQLMALANGSFDEWPEEP